MPKNLSIIRKWTPTDLEWDIVWKSCPYATFFHSREWANIWQKYTNGQIIPKPEGICFSDGLEILLPFCEEKFLHFFSKKTISSPAGTYGGWISSKSLDQEHQAVLIKYIFQTHQNLYLRLNPYEKSRISDLGGNVIPDTTSTLDLSASFDQIFHSWSKGHKSAVKKAQQAGVTIDIARSSDDWDSYYSAYLDSINRWGDNVSSFYKRSLFTILENQSSENIKLWLANYNGAVVAGALCFYSQDHVVYWHGAGFSKYFYLRPVNLLLYEAIRNAKDSGYSWFDFNPSGGHIGVSNFKQSFGTIQKNSDVIITTSKKMYLIKKIAKFSRSLVNTK